jgi:hypothetical protein
MHQEEHSDILVAPLHLDTIGEIFYQAFCAVCSMAQLSGYDNPTANELLE